MTPSRSLQLTISLFASGLFAQAAGSPAKSSSIDLLDPVLSQWEIFIGVPHTSVTGLPPGTFQSADVTVGTPLGLNHDPKKVFTTFMENGAVILHVSGEIFGGLSTKTEYANYHLSMDFKWGDRKWEPRLDQKRDSGILYHCRGEHGAFWNAWMSCLEAQVQETDFGDIHLLAGTKAKSRFRALAPKSNIFDPQSPTPWGYWTGHLSASAEPDRPHGDWNHLEVYVVGDSAVHVVNGIVVMAVTGALDHKGLPLKSGKIQLQSEGAECFYRDVRIAPIEAYPADIATKAGFAATPN